MGIFSSSPSPPPPPPPLPPAANPPTAASGQAWMGAATLRKGAGTDLSKPGGVKDQTNVTTAQEKLVGATTGNI